MSSVKQPGMCWCGTWVPHSEFQRGPYGTRVWRPSYSVGTVGIVQLAAGLWVLVTPTGKPDGGVVITSNSPVEGTTGIFPYREIANRINEIFVRSGATDLVDHAAEIMCGEIH